MFETPLTVVGTIVTDPVRRRAGDQHVMSFRVASNSRRRTAEGAWEPGNSLFATVSCWGRLANGVGASLAKGDHVIVVGHIHTSEYDDREGNRRTSVELRATALGPDLSRCVARIEHVRFPGPAGQGEPAPPPAEPEDAPGQVTGSSPDGPNNPGDGAALPLSA